MSEQSDGRVPLRAIAQKLGVSRMTVSRALRQHPAVAGETAEQIRRVARQLGYRPDPNLARVMEATRRGRLRAAPTTLAYLTAYASSREWREHPVRRRFFEGAQQRADECGYRLEEFSVRAPAMTDERLSDILRHRGIEGVLVAPLPEPQRMFERFRWEWFSVVQIGYSLPGPELHRAAAHQFQAMFLLAQRLHEAGYRRVGVAMDGEQDRRVHHHWRAGFLAAQSLWGAGAGLDLLMLADEWTRVRFDRWRNQAKPDAIITIGPKVGEWLAEAGVRVPGELGLANVDLRPDMKGVTGIDQNSAHVGAAAFDFLVSLLHRNERGIPEVPRVSLVHGNFVPGMTTRRARGVRGPARLAGATVT